MGKVQCFIFIYLVKKTRLFVNAFSFKIYFHLVVGLAEAKATEHGLKTK